MTGHIHGLASSSSSDTLCLRKASGRGRVKEYGAKPGAELYEFVGVKGGAFLATEDSPRVTCKACRARIKAREKGVSIQFSRAELWSLVNAFDAAFTEDGKEPVDHEVSRKLTEAWGKLA